VTTFPIEFGAVIRIWIRTPTRGFRRLPNSFLRFTLARSDRGLTDLRLNGHARLPSRLGAMQRTCTVASPGTSRASSTMISVRFGPAAQRLRSGEVIGIGGVTIGGRADRDRRGRSRAAVDVDRAEPEAVRS